MTNDQFFARVLCLFLCGILFIWAFKKMAQRNPDTEQSQTKNKSGIIKALGIVFFIFAVISAFIGVVELIYVDSPTYAREPAFSQYEVIRSPEATLYWGVPTSSQMGAIVMIFGSFFFFAIATYCFYFKSSKTSIVSKIGKVFFGILLYAFFMTSTEFNYFDIYEWMPKLFLLLLILLIIYVPKLFKKKRVVNNETQTTKADAMTVEVENIKIESENNENQNSYCRHCGKQIDYQSGKYCKYCGKEL